jgi:hypothetical protein
MPAFAGMTMGNYATLPATPAIIPATPAKAGVHADSGWMPAFAGMAMVHGLASPRAAVRSASKKA